MKQEELADNPFLVLEIAASATRMEVERAGQKLLGQLAIGLASVKSYPSPFGLRERDESKVRMALSILRDPEQRALYELWLGDAQAQQPPRLPGWPHALLSIGWRGPCTD
jgi:hypothetical protein